MIFAKLVTLTTMLDDTYDVHATIEECRQLNAAIQRWGVSFISIKICLFEFIPLSGMINLC
jgi:hypothetical protein